MRNADRALSLIALLAFAKNVAGAQQRPRQPVQGAVVLNGRVVDSLTGRPVSGARVSTRNTDHTAVADSVGGFSIHGMESRAVVLEIRTASLDSVMGSHRVTVTPKGETRVVIRVPSAQLVATALCGERTDARRGIILGSLTFNGKPVPTDTRITAAWGLESGTPADSVVTRVGTQGRFRLCGVPVDAPIWVRAAGEGAEAAPTPVQIPSDRWVTQADLVMESVTGAATLPVPRLVLQSASPASGSLRGVVVDSANQPAAKTQVTLLDVGRGTVTNDAGEFRFTDVPLGNHVIGVRRVGYEALEQEITVSATDTVPLRLVLRKAVSLTPIVVTDKAMQVFEENRRIGLGHFLTREQLAARDGSKLGEVLSELPGIHIRRVGGHAYIQGRNTITSLQRNTTCPVLEGMDVGRPGNRPQAPAKNCQCFAQIFLDDVMIYRGDTEGTNEVPDVNRFQVGSIENVEFYASPAETPAKYSRLNSACGVLVLHTRRSP